MAQLHSFLSHIRTLSLFLVTMGLTACGEDGSSQHGAIHPVDPRDQSLFALDLSQGERLVEVHHAVSGRPDPVTAAYQISVQDGFVFWHAGGRSPAFLEVVAVDVQDNDPTLMSARVRVHGGQQIVRGQGGDFAVSPVFQSVTDPVRYGVDGTNEAYIGRKDGKSTLFTYTSHAFETGPVLDSIGDIEVSPDMRAPLWTGRDDRTRVWGVGFNVYLTRPSWTQMGEDGVWAYWAKTADGHTVVVDHTAGPPYDALKGPTKSPTGKHLYYFGETDKEWTYHAETRQPEQEASHARSGFAALDRAGIQFHEKTELPYFVASTADGQHLVVGKADNTSDASGAFDRISVHRWAIEAQTVATGVKDKKEHVLLGVATGAGFDRISRLGTAENEATVVYIGKDESGERVVLGDQAQTVFESIERFQQTKERQIPVYVGVRDDGERAVLNGDAGPPQDRIRQIVIRKNDAMAWLADTQDEGAVIGLGTQAGKRFDTIKRIQVSPSGELWYDGWRGDDVHRVIEATESAGYTAVGAPVFTAISGNLVYAARKATSHSVETEDGTDETIKVADTIVHRTDSVATYNTRHESNGRTRGLLTGDTRDLPRLRTVANTDHYFYQASADNGVSVGFDATAHGPFADVSELRANPAGTGVDFFAQTGETWAVQRDADRGVELDATRRLRYSPDSQHIRYDGRRGDTRLTFVDAEEYLEVRGEQLNRNGDRYAYQGRREAGWHAVAGGVHSGAFSKIDRTRFTPDGYGITVVGTRDDGARLVRKPHDGAFEEMGLFETVGAVTEHYDPWTVAAVVGPEIDEDEEAVANAAVIADVEVEAEAAPSAEEEAKGPPALYFWNPKAPDEDAPEEVAELERVTTAVAPKTEGVFLALGRSPSDVRAAWLITEVRDDGGVLLLGGPETEEEAIAFTAMQVASGWTPMVLSLTVPYTYAAKAAGNRGTVYAEHHYARIEDLHFTPNRTFFGIGRGVRDATDHVIFNDMRTQGYASITHKLPHPNVENNSKDLYAFRARQTHEDESPYGWVITSNSAEVNELGFVDSAGTHAAWTPWSTAGDHTLAWNGTHADWNFQGVGVERYDSHTEPTVTEHTERLAYVGTRGRQSSVFHEGVHHPWYDVVRDLSHQGKTDRPVYIGQHQYVDRSDQAPMRPDTRHLERVVHGDSMGPLTDGIFFWYPGATLADTKYVAAMDGKDVLLAGTKVEQGPYEMISHVYRVVQTDKDRKGTGTTIHFLAREKKGWVEIHDGRRGTKVDAISGSAFASSIPEGMSDTEIAPGQYSGRSVLVNDKGRFDYLGIRGEDLVFVRNSKAGPAYHEVGSVSYSPDGDVAWYVGHKRGSVQVVQEGKVHAEFAAVSSMQWHDEARMLTYIGRVPDDGGVRMVVNGTSHPAVDAVDPLTIHPEGPNGALVVYTADPRVKEGTTDGRVLVVNGMLSKVYASVAAGPFFNEKTGIHAVMNLTQEVDDTYLEEAQKIAAAGVARALDRVAAHQEARPKARKTIEDAYKIEIDEAVKAAIVELEKLEKPIRNEARKVLEDAVTAAIERESSLRLARDTLTKATAGAVARITKEHAGRVEPATVAVLLGTVEKTRAIEYQQPSELETGVGMFLRKDDGWHAYATGTLGPAFASLPKSVPAPIWREDLASSRYVAENDDGLLVVGAKVHAGPFDSVGTLAYSHWKDGVIYYTGTRGQLTRGYISDKPVVKGQSVKEPMVIEDALLTRATKANLGVVHFRESFYDALERDPKVEDWPWPIAMLQQDWSQRLLVGNTLSSSRWMLYDLRGHLDDEAGMARLSWVYGNLNRSKGLLEIKADGFELEMPDGSADVAVPGLVYLTKVPAPPPKVDEKAVPPKDDGVTDAEPGSGLPAG